jgi:hypothetical protein
MRRPLPPREECSRTLTSGRIERFAPLRTFTASRNDEPASAERGGLPTLVSAAAGLSFVFFFGAAGAAAGSSAGAASAASTKTPPTRGRTCGIARIRDAPPRSDLEPRRHRATVLPSRLSRRPYKTTTSPRRHVSSKCCNVACQKLARFCLARGQKPLSLEWTEVG